MKGIEDIEGDKNAGIRTIALVYGVRKAVYVSTFVLALLIVASPVPVISFGYSMAYLAIALLGVDLPVLYAIKYLWSNPVENAWRATRILKIPLAMGLIAFLVG